MRKGFWMKGAVLGIIVLFIATGIIPSESMTITRKAASTTSVQLVINNDGSGDPTDKNVDAPAYFPDSGITSSLMINFTITGINNTGTTAFYGDDPWEDWKNISLIGDILYPVNGTTLYHVGTEGDWNCYVTPTKPSGVISFRIDWPGNGSANNSIQIVNGNYVTPLVDWFVWGEDFNLTVLVQDIDGAVVKLGNLYIIWEEDDYEFNRTSGNNKPGNGLNGEYTFWITKEDQGEFAPKNITITAQDYPGSEYWGYAKVAMKQPSSPPIPPIIDGPYYGKTNTTYTFFLGPITDPDGDQLYCLFDWGDGNISGWFGPYNSGQTVSLSHVWSEPGNYTINVKLKDSYGAESDWSAPFFITIVQLKKAFFLGTFESLNQTEDLFIIEPRFFIVFPSYQIFYREGTIVISKDFHGYPGTTFTLGVGDVAIL
jgi:PKD domain